MNAQEYAEKIAYDLLGTCDVLESRMDRDEVELDSTDVEDALCGLNIELCQGCGWRAGEEKQS